MVVCFLGDEKSNDITSQADQKCPLLPSNLGFVHTAFGLVLQNHVDDKAHNGSKTKQ